MPEQSPFKLYLDTSIINFAIATQQVEKEKGITLKLLNQIVQGKFEGYISDIVLQEIQKTPDETKRQALLNEIQARSSLQNILSNNRAETLAEKYISEGIIPVRYRDDALHIAVATVYNLDVIVSWNFEHLVKTKTRREVQGINTLMGYRFIDIATPTEVIGDEGTTTHA